MDSWRLHMLALRAPHCTCWRSVLPTAPADAPCSPLHLLSPPPHPTPGPLLPSPPSDGFYSQGSQGTRARAGPRVGDRSWAPSFIHSFIPQEGAGLSLSGRGWGCVSTRWAAPHPPGDLGRRKGGRAEG